jgi:thiosulfate/3-mercaptopyruvate sulfurtransferase
MRLSVLFLLLALPALAQESQNGTVRVVEPVELARILPSVSVIDARGRQAFEKGHLPGSQRMDWKDWTEEKPGVVGYLFGYPERWGKVAPANPKLETRLSALGLANGRPVAIIGDPAGWGEEGRIAWTLLYWGADEVLLLDGGFPAWQRAGLTVENGPPRPIERSVFQVRLRKSRRIEMGELQLELRKRLLLDARSEEEFAGKKLRGQRRGGRLPGARLVPAKRLLEEDGRYIDREPVPGCSPSCSRPASESSRRTTTDRSGSGLPGRICPWSQRLRNRDDEPGRFIPFRSGLT